ncbi:MAG TPA: sigma-70 family RNA polymerase sigma factor [Puia sp.]|jgi:RNA polymerase sigma-70 factor (ECF subfamily)
MSAQQAKENFLKLIQENKGIIIRICNSYCPDKHYREDLAQEIIFHLWKSGDHYDPNQKFSTWMYRVALNVAISYYRKGKTSVYPLSLDGEQHEVEDQRADETEENINLLQRFIHELGKMDKALMILFLEGKTYAEIADILGISETNVGTKISRIKKRIKQNFSDLNK